MTRISATKLKCHVMSAVDSSTQPILQRAAAHVAARLLLHDAARYVEACSSDSARPKACGVCGAQAFTKCTPVNYSMNELVKTLANTDYAVKNVACVPAANIDLFCLCLALLLQSAAAG